ncbi:Dynein light chain 2, cytoplasmic [Symbiodinium microadriaticum]|uniref:Dynein light chain 2, cytoplasmic n=2 Tax=Symbiodinium TaxID=2949 RepID=A0A1Q9EGU3_SYMMI|nr:Dynein light chain 2, cytoplasmic [Symbiodinium microadriaticum]
MARKSVMICSSVISKQRELTYNTRKEFLANDDEAVLKLVKEWGKDAVKFHIEQVTGKTPEEEKSAEEKATEFKEYFGLEMPELSAGMKPAEVEAKLNEVVQQGITEKAASYEEFRPGFAVEAARIATVVTIDDEWKALLQKMDALKQTVGLAAYKGSEPLKEYQVQGFRMYQKVENKYKARSVSRWLRSKPKKDAKQESCLFHTAVEAQRGDMKPSILPVARDVGALQRFEATRKHALTLTARVYEKHDIPGKVTRAPGEVLSLSPEHGKVIKNADMAEDMQQDAIDCATQALEKYNIEKDIAAFIKKERPSCCIKFPDPIRSKLQRLLCDPRDEARHFIYFYLGQVAILVFKSLFRALTHPPQAPSGDPAPGLHTAIATAMDWSDSSGGVPSAHGLEFRLQPYCLPGASVRVESLKFDTLVLAMKILQVGPQLLTNREASPC